MPARQRRYLNWKFGHNWVKKHHFDNRGKLPERVTEVTMQFRQWIEASNPFEDDPMAVPSISFGEGHYFYALGWNGHHWRKCRDYNKENSSRSPDYCLRTFDAVIRLLAPELKIDYCWLRVPVSSLDDYTPAGRRLIRQHMLGKWMIGRLNTTPPYWTFGFGQHFGQMIHVARLFGINISEPTREELEDIVAGDV